MGLAAFTPEKIAEMEYIALRVVAIMKGDEVESKTISFADARQELGISDDTLTKRIKAAGVRTW